jgi:hypothetical protein
MREAGELVTLARGERSNVRMRSEALRMKKT